jgi:hypothetical protein
MIDPRPTLEAPDDDPYLWLEEIDGERALAWVEPQNAATLARFGDMRFAADRDVLAAIFDRPDNIPLIGRRGPRVFNFWKDAEHPRGHGARPRSPATALTRRNGTSCSISTRSRRKRAKTGPGAGPRRSPAVTTAPS